MAKTYRFAIPLMLVWLLAWIGLSWPAVQDDALIHLRYADNLIRFHFISYDGVHHDYGASSLLYVSLLAVLRTMSASANLARGVSSAIHLLLFGAIAWAFWLRGAKWPASARLATLILLLILILPGAVRWLDDGMETGLVISAASLVAWLLHGEQDRVMAGLGAGGARRFLAFVALGFFTVLLRTELVLLCGASFFVLVSARMTILAKGSTGGSVLGRLGLSSHLLLGAVLALIFILTTMHRLLPDTARAKSLGIAHWWNPFHDTAVTLGGAMSFGAGMLLFWLLTLALVARRERPSRMTFLANCFFPVVLAMASLRGQEIQGVRYFAWTFFFAIVWNILELGTREPRGVTKARSDPRTLLYAFLVLLILEWPFEAVAMYRVLTRRAATMREFQAQHLEQLGHLHGVASDIGYVGYFTHASLCDLAGLVNGRVAASLSSSQRAMACVNSDPDFLFLNAGQLRSIARYHDFSRWQICGRYDFANVSVLDSHYLIVRPALAEEACRATDQVRTSISSVL